MKSFKNLHEEVATNFRFNGKHVDMIRLDPTTSTVGSKGRFGIESSEVHNSKIYIAGGKYKGKSVQHVLDTDASALDQLIK